MLKDNEWAFLLRIITNLNVCTCYSKKMNKKFIWSNDSWDLYKFRRTSTIFWENSWKILSTLICQHYQSTSRDPAIYYLSCKNDLSFTTQHTCYRTFLNGCMQIDVLYEKGGKTHYEIKFKVFTPYKNIDTYFINFWYVYNI